VSSVQSIRVVGGALPPSLVAHLQDGTLGSAEGRSAKSYHLLGSESVRDGSARAWSYLRRAWTAWQDAEQGRVEGSAGTGPAREKWLLPLLRELGYGQVPAAGSGLNIDGVDYPVSHLWQHVPIHLLGPGVSLDKRNPGIAGAARAPQAMVQELLNRSDAHLWAVLSNGTHLRLLRDSTAMVGAAYMEFDLDAIFDGELYAEWLLLFQLAHVSRLEKRSTEGGAADCWLESWRGEATDAGARALGRLEYGVEGALGALGSGFIVHRANGWLVEALRSGEVTRHDYHRALLRLIYRMLFIFVAEDRGLLLDPSKSVKAKQRYAQYFSTARLRRLSRVRAGGPQGDLWQSQRLVLQALGTAGLGEIAVAPLGGVFGPDARKVVPTGAPDQRDLLWGAEIANADLLSAVEQLAWVEVTYGRTQPVDYRNLGAEELGSVYEALLELDPVVDLDERTFAVERVAGNDRKTTGSYYTSPGLVSALLDTALDPVIDKAAPVGVEAAAGESALLALTVCDPACGSGGFLVAAARRIAHRLAEVRAGDDTPNQEMVHRAMRDVVGRCIYGVDLNDLAAELAKVSLWLEALEPGKPLSFLDARIRTGNSLVGTTPALLGEGVPDEAFKEIDGDDKKIAREIRKRNKAESAGQDLLFGGTVIDLAALANERQELLTNVDTIDEVEQQRTQWEKVQQSAALQQHRLQADAWCAAFVWPLNASMALPPTSGVVRALGGQSGEYHDTATVVERLAEMYRFFHWHLEFPEVFLGVGAAGAEGWSGGFSCMLGNPPWEHIELKEQEYFASRDPEIAKAAGARRKKLITALSTTDPVLDEAYRQAKREVDGLRHFTSAGRYPLTGRGRVNTYAVFCELFRSLTGPKGRSGVIAPTGVATDATTQYFFKALVEAKTLAALYDFENAKPLFEGVHRSFKFCLLTMTGRQEKVKAATFAFFLHDPSQITEREFRLTPEEIILLNPNTGTCPIFRSRRDAEITLHVYRKLPVLVPKARSENWSPALRQAAFNMTSDSHLFVTLSDLMRQTDHPNDDVILVGGKTFVPLWESKAYHQYDPDWGPQPEGIEDGPPDARGRARYWVDSKDAKNSIGEWPHDWLLAFRKVCRATDERTSIAAILPGVALGNSSNCVLGVQPKIATQLLAEFNSFAFDYVLRQKMGGINLNLFYVEQMPTTLPFSHQTCEWNSTTSMVEWITPRAVELTWTRNSLDQYAESNGCVGDPFVKIEGRRFMIRREIDAAFFHLFGVPRDDVDYIMETFPIVKRKDIAVHGEYRTKRLILDVYDAMQKAIDTGTEYQTILDPPPGDGPRHPAKGA
jgi:DNA-binding transcriptional regulator/RsmH inhibitor MraZ